MNAKVFLAAAVAASSLSLAAYAQYTPGAGGAGGIYIAPSAPQVPSPAYPAQPAGQPPYSWETAPQQPAPQQQLQQVAPQSVQVVQQPQVIVPRLSDAQLSDLTASIALYPDPLLAEMLPAATYVQELTYADRWLAQHPGADQYTLDSLPLHPSVKTLLHYPTVLSLMADHVDWTQALGVAFMYQPNDLMESVQRWRIMAVSYGTLASSPQLDVLQQGSTIIIVPPPQQQVIFVPIYDPQLVYVRPLRPRRDIISFSTGGFSLEWVQNDVDWRGHEIHVPVHHDHDWDDGPGGRGPGGGRGGDGRGGSGGGTGGRGGGGSGGGTPPPGGAGGGRGGRGSTTVIEKTVFVHDDVKPAIVYPDKLVTPTPDKKVISLPPSRRGPSPIVTPSIPAPSGAGPTPITPFNTRGGNPPASAPAGRGRGNTPPGTPF